MAKNLILYDKYNKIINTTLDVIGTTGTITIENLTPETDYPEGEFYVGWEVNGKNLPKATVPEFTTLRQMREKVVIVYFSDLTEKQLVDIKGDSAYKIALDNGFKGSQEEWLKSLKGEPGIQGEKGEPGKDGVDITEGGSAYEIAQAHGFEGTREEWLESLKGEPGKQGEKGDPGEDGFGVDGASAYEIALENGFVGNIQDFLDSLEGKPGKDGLDGNDGLSAYEIAKEYEYKGTEQEWLKSLKGEPGEKGKPGEQGIPGERGVPGKDGDSFKYSDFTTDQLNDLRVYVGGGEATEIKTAKTLEDSLFVKPQNKEHLGNYATSVGDKYFKSFQTLGTTPVNSLNPDSSLTIHGTGYFFYNFNAIDGLAPGNNFSVKIKTNNVDDKTKLQYSITDSSGGYLVTISSIPKTGDGLYVLENIKIPDGASQISVRLDNRSGTSDLVVSEMFSFSGGLEKIIYNSTIENIIKSLHNEVEKLERNMTNIGSEKVKESLPLKYIQPKNFTLQSHLLYSKIYTDGLGKYSTDFNIENLQNQMGVTYYVSYNGSDSNDGLSKETPFKNLNTAIRKNDIGTLMIEGGEYYRSNAGILFGNMNKDINIIGYNGEPKIFAADNLKFTNFSGYTNVKQATRSAVSRVIDKGVIDAYGDYYELKKVNSIDEVENTEYSWYSDSSNVYINGNSETTVCLLNIDMINIKGDYNIYLENIELIGGRRTLRLDSSTGTLVLNNCKLSYSIQSNGNGIEMIGGKYAISKSTEISKQMMDGFNYHKGANGELPYFIEIDCVGRDNGIMRGGGGSRSDNGSTAHDGIKGIRINGLYVRNDGGNLADVNTGTETLNLGCVTSDGLQPYNNIIQDCTCFYEFCTSYGNDKGILINGTGSLYNRMSNLTGNIQNVDGTEVKY